MHFSELQIQDSQVSRRARLVSCVRKLEGPLLPYFTHHWRLLEEFVLFQTVLHLAHIGITLSIQKSGALFLNDGLFLLMSGTALFFVSFPSVLVENRKIKPLHTDSVVYLLCYSLPITILSLHLGLDRYVFSADIIQTWNARLWAFFVLNVCSFLPGAAWNLVLAHRYGELSIHLVGYFFFFTLLVCAFVSKSFPFRIHLHHWVISSCLMCFFRFAERSSRVFHGFFLGIFVHGISFFGADPIFELRDPPQGSE